MFTSPEWNLSLEIKWSLRNYTKSLDHCFWNNFSNRAILFLTNHIWKCLARLEIINFTIRFTWRPQNICFISIYGSTSASVKFEFYVLYLFLINQYFDRSTRMCMPWKVQMENTSWVLTARSNSTKRWFINIFSQHSNKLEKGTGKESTHRSGQHVDSCI